MQIQDLRTIYDYNYWANARMVAAGRKLSAEQFAAPAAFPYGGLRGTLLHLMEAEWTWRLRLQHGTVMTDLVEADFPTLDALVTRWQDEEREMQTWLRSLSDGDVAGTYWLRPNQPGLGSHVVNAAYMVSPDTTGKGIGRQMAGHSIDEARKLGFTAMQFNFVVKSNAVAVKLWQSIGFGIIGEIPEAFDHSKNGLTNAYIMYRKL